MPDLFLWNKMLAPELNGVTDSGTENRVYKGIHIPPNIQKKRHYLFRDKLTVEEQGQIQLDDVALYSVTDSHHAEEITQLLLNYIPRTGTITDGTACVGGNSMSFCRYFKHVNAVERDAGRSAMLRNNLNVIGLKNFTIYTSDFVSTIPQYKQDLVFLDPPWGGRISPLYICSNHSQSRTLV